MVPHGCLQTAEAEIVGTFFEARAGKANSSGIAALCQPVDHLSSRVTKAHHLCHLIKSLPCGIVPGSTQIEIVAKTAHQIEKRMTP